tara:strand:- start:370 stop:471 length:102 start_codon:yes stop_codon:yes gene_type:complete
MIKNNETNILFLSADNLEGNETGAVGQKIIKTI